MQTTKQRRLKLSSPYEIRKALSRIANMTLNGEIESKVANTIILACNAILSGIRTDEQQRKIEELEALMRENNIK